MASGGASSQMTRGSYARIARFWLGVQRNVTSSPTAAPVIALTTFGADADAARVARVLVEERLAACVNILPAMTSIYRWKGAVEEDREQQLVIKTTPSSVARLAARLRALHPYELPEFVVLDASASEQYAEWVGESVAE